MRCLTKSSGSATEAMRLVYTQPLNSAMVCRPSQASVTPRENDSRNASSYSGIRAYQGLAQIDSPTACIRTAEKLGPRRAATSGAANRRLSPGKSGPQELKQQDVSQARNRHEKREAVNEAQGIRITNVCRCGEQPIDAPSYERYAQQQVQHPQPRNHGVQCIRIRPTKWPPFNHFPFNPAEPPYPMVHADMRRPGFGGFVFSSPVRRLGSFFLPARQHTSAPRSQHVHTAPAL